MADIRILRGQRIVPDIDQALHVAGYQKANLGRDKSLARCQELVPVLRPLMQAKAVLAFTDDKVYVILTLGEAVSRQLDRYEKRRRRHGFSLVQRLGRYVPLGT